MPDDSNDASDEDGSDLLADAADRLYSAPVEEFMSLRTELSKAAKADGDAAAAKQIGALRKPTVGASLVNRQALAEPDTVDRLADLYDRLRQAHDDLDAGALRDLSTERRSVVGELARDALERAAGTPSLAVRDEVVSSFDAAVADPSVAARLGRLTKGERWSGFGVALPTDDTPALRLVRGGKSAARPAAALPTAARSTAARSTAARSTAAGAKPAGAKPAGADPSEPAVDVPTAAEKREASAAARRKTRQVEKARSAFESAEDSLASAERAEQSGADRVKSLTAEIAELAEELDEAKRDLDKARREVKSARTRRREARFALDRAER